MDTKIVLFAVSEIDALNYCASQGIDFTQIVWVLNYQLLGSVGLKDVDDVLYTDLFKTMPAYGEATFMYKIDKGEE